MADTAKLMVQFRGKVYSKKDEAFEDLADGIISENEYIQIIKKLGRELTLLEKEFSRCIIEVIF